MYISIGILNKYEFYVKNNSGFPLTFIYEGKNFELPVTLVENRRFLIGELTRDFGEENPSNIIADYLDDEFEVLRKIFGIYKFEKYSEDLLYDNGGKFLSKKADFEVVLTDENYDQAIKMIIDYVALNSGRSYDDVLKIFKNPRQELTDEIFADIPLIFHGIEEYKKLEDLKNSSSYSNNLFVFAKPKIINPLLPEQV